MYFSIILGIACLACAQCVNAATLVRKVRHDGTIVSRGGSNYFKHASMQHSVGKQTMMRSQMNHAERVLTADGRVEVKAGQDPDDTPPTDTSGEGASITVTCDVDIFQDDPVDPSLDNSSEHEDSDGTRNFLEYGICTEDDGTAYYLQYDDTLAALQSGAHVTLSLLETTPSFSTPANDDPPWQEEGLPLYKIAEVIDDGNSGDENDSEDDSGGDYNSDDEPSLISRKQSQAPHTISLLTVLINFNNVKAVRDGYYSEAIVNAQNWGKPDNGNGQPGEPFEIGLGNPKSPRICDPTQDPSCDSSKFGGSLSDLVEKASYGRMVMPKEKGKTVTVEMNFNAPGGCQFTKWSNQALNKMKTQHPDVKADDYNFHQFIIPSERCGWWGMASGGCGNPRRLPRGNSKNNRRCKSWIRDIRTGTRLHELGHNWGLSHARSTDRDFGNDIETGGMSGVRMCDWLMAYRAHFGLIKETKGEIVTWDPSMTAPIILGAMSEPLSNVFDAVAIKIRAMKGETLWVQYRNGEGYSKYGFSGGQRNKVKNKVYVHLMKKLGRNRMVERGAILKKVLVKGEGYQLSQVASLFYKSGAAPGALDGAALVGETAVAFIFVCDTGAVSATVTLGSSMQDAKDQCASPG